MFSVAAILLMVSAVCELTDENIFLPNIVSTKSAHENIDWVSKNGAQIFFTRAAPDFSQSRLMQVRKVNDQWVVEPLSMLAGGYDASLAMAPDLMSILFTSTRAGKDILEGDWNIWHADALYKNEEWAFGDASPMPNPVNTTSNECCTVYDESGGFYFSSDRAGSWDIYHARLIDGGYEVALLPGAINTDYGEWPNAYIAETSILLFSSIRSSGLGGDDIYVSNKSGGQWTSGQILDARINKSGYEDSARIFRENFFWSSRPPSSTSPVDLNVSNIYIMPTACIDELG